MKNSKPYNNLVMLITIFGLILLLQTIFRLEDSFIILFLIYFISGVLIPKLAKDKEIMSKYKIILYLTIFLLSNLTIFYKYEFKDIKHYLLWFFTILIFSYILNLISKTSNNKKI